MKVLCKIFGHKWMPKTNSIGQVIGEIVLYSRKIRCDRCKCFYLSSYTVKEHNGETNPDINE